MEVSVSLAAAAAQKVIGACVAGWVQLVGAFYELDFLAAGVDFVQAVFVEVAEAVVVQHVEIAGVDAAVGFYDGLDAADASLVAGFGHVAGGEAYVVFELTDVGLGAFFDVFVPELE